MHAWVAAGKEIRISTVHFSVKRRNKFSERAYQRRQVILDGIPDNRGAEITVGVDGEVAEVNRVLSARLHTQIFPAERAQAPAPSAIY
jgi:hypothetical protein